MNNGVWTQILDLDNLFINDKFYFGRNYNRENVLNLFKNEKIELNFFIVLKQIIRLVRFLSKKFKSTPYIIGATIE